MCCGRTATCVFLGVDGGDSLCTIELMVFWCSLGELQTGDMTWGGFCLGGVQTGVFGCSLGELRTRDVTSGCFCLGGVQTGEPGDMGAATGFKSTNDLITSSWATFFTCS